MRFDYKCGECGRIHERVFGVGVAPPSTCECPMCDNQATRIWSAPHVHVAATEFVGKMGTYLAKTYDWLKYEMEPECTPVKAARVNEGLKKAQIQRVVSSIKRRKRSST